jgi:hypothetical protein
MFELFSRAAEAQNQVGLFLVALVSIGIGILLVGAVPYRYLFDVRVQGRIVGIRQGERFIYSVYRYSLPSGRSCEGTSNLGTDSLGGRRTGKVVALWVNRNHPDRVQEVTSPLWSLLGVLLLAIGAKIFHTAATTWPVGPLTWIFAAALLMMLAARYWHLSLPDEKRPGFGTRKSALSQFRSTAIGSIPMQRIEDFLTPERFASEVQRRAQLVRLAPILAIAGIALLVWSASLGRTLARMELFSLPAPGVVESFAVSTSSDHSSTYAPVVRFTNVSGETVRFRDRLGSNPSFYRVGESVKVRYLPDDPQEPIIDRGVWNWAPPILALLLGAALLRGGIRIFRDRNQEPTYRLEDPQP